MSNPWHGYEDDIESEQKRRGRQRWREQQRERRRVKRKAENEAVEFMRALDEAVHYHSKAQEAMRLSNDCYEQLHRQAVRDDKILYSWEKTPVKKASPITSTCTSREEFDILSLLSKRDQKSVERWIRAR